MNELKDLVIMKDGKAVTTSLETAKIFDKRHHHVMRDINNLKKDVPNFGEMFFKAETVDSYGRKQKISVNLTAQNFAVKNADKPCPNRPPA